MEFKIGLVRSKFHRLTAAAELKRPRPGDDGGFEFELPSQPGADGTDALNRFIPDTFGIHQGSVQAADGYGRFVDNIHDNHDDVFVIIIDFHFHRGEVGVQGACSGAVVITHVGSPVPTDERLYFNGLLEKNALNAIEDGFRKGATSPRRPPCDAFDQSPFGTLKWLNER